MAAEEGHLGVVRMLIDAAADINAPSKVVPTPFLEPFCGHLSPKVDKSWHLSPKVGIYRRKLKNLVGIYRQKLIKLEEGHLEVVRMLVDAAADVNAPSKVVPTPFLEPHIRQSRPDSGHKTVTTRFWPYVRQSRPDSETVTTSF